MLIFLLQLCCFSLLNDIHEFEAVYCMLPYIISTLSVLELVTVLPDQLSYHLTVLPSYCLTILLSYCPILSYCLIVPLS